LHESSRQSAKNHLTISGRNPAALNKITAGDCSPANRKDEKNMKKVEVFWMNAECALNPGTPCIFAWANLPNCEQLSAEFALSDNDFDSPEDCEPSEDADRRAAAYLREAITEQAKASGFPPEMLDFQF
jgi:hypothetical protein